MTLQFSDYYWGRTKGGGYFWIYLAVQGFSNFMPFQFPVDAEAWKVMTNKIIAWEFGGQGGEAVAAKLVAACEKPNTFHQLYDLTLTTAVLGDETGLVGALALGRTTYPDCRSKNT